VRCHTDPGPRSPRTRIIDCPRRCATTLAFWPSRGSPGCGRGLDTGGLAAPADQFILSATDPVDSRADVLRCRCRQKPVLRQRSAGRRSPATAARVAYLEVRCQFSHGLGDTLAPGLQGLLAASGSGLRCSAHRDHCTVRSAGWPVAARTAATGLLAPWLAVAECTTGHAPESSSPPFYFVTVTPVSPHSSFLFWCRLSRLASASQAAPPTPPPPRPARAPLVPCAPPSWLALLYSCWNCLWCGLMGSPPTAGLPPGPPTADCPATSHPFWDSMRVELPRPRRSGAGRAAQPGTRALALFIAVGTSGSGD